MQYLLTGALADFMFIYDFRSKAHKMISRDDYNLIKGQGVDFVIGQANPRCVTNNLKFESIAGIKIGRIVLNSYDKTSEFQFILRLYQVSSDRILFDRNFKELITLEDTDFCFQDSCYAINIVGGITTDSINILSNYSYRIDFDGHDYPLQRDFNYEIMQGVVLGYPVNSDFAEYAIDARNRKSRSEVLNLCSKSILTYGTDRNFSRGFDWSTAKVLFN